MKSWPDLRSRIEGPEGYAIVPLALNEDEISTIREFIRRQYLARITVIAPDIVDKFASRGVERYHEIAHFLDHSAAWPKKERLFSAAAVAFLKSTEFFSLLRLQYGDLELSDEEHIGRWVVYWRIVRPFAPSDVGPMHADKWFWDLGYNNYALPDGFEDRVKVWLPVHVETLSSLGIVPGSHLKDGWKWHGEMRHGVLKPAFDEPPGGVNPISLEAKPGDAVVFHDRLLHGGALNRGKNTRVSFEFTVMFKSAERRLDA